MTVEIIPVPGIPEVRPGDALGPLITEALQRARVELRSGDVVAVTQKVVSKAEGRIVPEGPEGKAGWVAAESRRVVARRGDLVIAETAHGFVCANAGVDASNVAEGFLTLLPEDPDGSAERIRTGLMAGAGGRDLSVVVTDTFGRPWREGLVNVAIGCAGLPALVDLRGTKDAAGRVLEATVEALADQVAAASGLVMGKADGVPVAIVRGLSRPDAPSAGARALVRAVEDDLFRESPLQTLRSLAPTLAFGPGRVTKRAMEEAVEAACAAPWSHGAPPPWLFVVVWPGAVGRRLAWALAPPEAALLRAAAIVIPCARLGDAQTETERETLLLAGGAAIQNLMLALHAQGLASGWVSSTRSRRDETRAALELPDEWSPLGGVAVGLPSGPASPPAPSFDTGRLLRWIG